MPHKLPPKIAPAGDLSQPVAALALSGMSIDIGEDKLVGLEDPFLDNRAGFLHDRDGRIAWLRIMGRIHARLRQRALVATL